MKKRALISFILALLMVFGTFSAFAAGSEEIKFGDKSNTLLFDRMSGFSAHAQTFEGKTGLSKYTVAERANLGYTGMSRYDRYVFQNNTAYVADYQYVAIEYYYASEIADVGTMNILLNEVTIGGTKYSAAKWYSNVNGASVTNQWATAIFDISGHYDFMSAKAGMPADTSAAMYDSFVFFPWAQSTTKYINPGELYIASITFYSAAEEEAVPPTIPAKSGASNATIPASFLYANTVSKGATGEYFGKADVTPFTVPSGNVGWAAITRNDLAMANLYNAKVAESQYVAIEYYYESADDSVGTMNIKFPYIRMADQNYATEYIPSGGDKNLYAKYYSNLNGASVTNQWAVALFDISDYYGALINSTEMNYTGDWAANATFGGIHINPCANENWVSGCEGTLYIGNITFYSDALSIEGPQMMFDDDANSIRFVGLLDDYANYDAAGFYIGASYTADPTSVMVFDKPSTLVYNSIVANGATVTAADINAKRADDTIFTYVLKDIPKDLGTVTFEITPYVVKDGRILTGLTYSVTYVSNGTDNSCITAPVLAK